MSDKQSMSSFSESLAQVTSPAFTQVSTHNEYPEFGVHISFNTTGANFFLHITDAVRLMGMLRDSINHALSSPEFPEHMKKMANYELKYQKWLEKYVAKSINKNNILESTKSHTKE